MTNILKQTGKTTADLAREAAKKIVGEPLEILKSATPAHLQEKDSPNIIQEALAATTPNARENIDIQALNAQTQKRLGELEQEIAKIRQERAAKTKEWTEQQQALMGQGKNQNVEKPFIEPQSKKKRGFMGIGGAKKKQGTKELGKQISG